MENMHFELPLVIIALLFTFIVVALDAMGASKKDRNLHHKGTILGTVGIIIAIVYTMISTVYQLFILHG